MMSGFLEIPRELVNNTEISLMAWKFGIHFEIRLIIEKFTQNTMDISPLSD